jgi:FixJ family two-component response regulator
VFLRKPFTPAVLARTIRRAIDDARAAVTHETQPHRGDVGSAAD